MFSKLLNTSSRSLLLTKSYKLSNNNNLLYNHVNKITSCNFSNWISSYNKENKDEERYKLLFNHALPLAETSPDNFYTEFSSTKDAFTSALSIRNDLNKIIKSLKEKQESNKSNDLDSSINKLNKLDNLVKKWLSFTLAIDSLELKRISFENSTGLVLENITKNEGVHTIRSLPELKKRLENGKRCYGIFHKKFLNEPLAFIYVALTTELCDSLASLDTTKTEENPTHAIFYSVNSPLTGLKGLDIASLLIKEVVQNLQQNHPTIKVFSTLSPIPKFNSYLKSLLNDSSITPPKLPSNLNDNLVNALKNYKEKYPNSILNKNKDSSLTPLNSLITVVTSDIPEWARDKEFTNAIGPIMKYIGANYIVNEKVNRIGQTNLPLDDVARFHLRNGAIFHSINWMANPSLNGLTSSSSLMINYLYHLPDIKKNKKDLDNGIVATSRGIKDILENKAVKIGFPTTSYSQSCKEMENKL